MTPAEVGVIGLLNFFELSTIPIPLAIVLYKENNKIFMKKKIMKNNLYSNFIFMIKIYYI